MEMEQTVSLTVYSGSNQFVLTFTSLEVTILEVKQSLNKQYKLNVDEKLMKLVINGKVRKDGELLSNCRIKAKPGKVVKAKGNALWCLCLNNVFLLAKLLFEKEHYDQIQGKKNIESSSGLLKTIEKDVDELTNRVKHRMITVTDAHFELIEVETKLQTLKGRILESKTIAEEASIKSQALENIARVEQKIAVSGFHLSFFIFHPCPV